jgi:acylphosphatase
VQVEGEAQGSDEVVQQFLQQIGKGPRMAQVVKLEKREMEPREGEDRFQVMRTAESLFGSEC